jgi:hypothetical protein
MTTTPESPSPYIVRSQRNRNRPSAPGLTTTGYELNETSDLEHHATSQIQPQGTGYDVSAGYNVSATLEVVPEDERLGYFSTR